MKKAYLVKIDLIVRVIVDDKYEPDIDPEFDEEAFKKVTKRIKEEGISFIGEGIEDIDLDEENPYDPEYDD